MTEFQELFRDPLVQKFNSYSQHIFQQLVKCHTAKMGLHRLACNQEKCSNEQYQYHCCGNRHCPNCGGLKKEEWIENRTRELLPTPYYHLVFTLPHELHSLILGNRKQLFKLLFDSASQTILNHSKMPEYLGAECGITMVLHTWGQDLSFHPHVHCIVTGGGFDGENWVAAKRKKNNFLFAQASLRKMYKAIFLEQLAKLDLKADGIDLPKLIKQIGYKKWNVYAKAPFGGPAQVVEYLGRYTHKIAITRHRILNVTDQSVRFRYKDYADDNKTKIMCLSRKDFLQRFELHFLPHHFTKIRHYGFLQNNGKHKRLEAIRSALKLSPLKAVVRIPASQRMLEKYGKDFTVCPCCKIGKMEIVYTFRAGIKQIEKKQTMNKLNNKASPCEFE
jgi:hypothetical protein